MAAGAPFVAMIDRAIGRFYGGRRGEPKGFFDSPCEWRKYLLQWAKCGRNAFGRTVSAQVCFSSQQMALRTPRASQRSNSLEENCPRSVHGQKRRNRGAV